MFTIESSHPDNFFFRKLLYIVIEPVSPEGTYCDTVQVPSSVGDMELN